MDKIDSTFSELESEYNQALKESNKQLNILQANAKNLNEFSDVIKTNTNKAIYSYEEIQIKYAKEIEYAAKGADQRKKDMDEMFKQSTKLMLDLTYIIENISQYIAEGDKGLIVTEDYDKDKVYKLRKDLNSQIEDFREAIKDKK